jgi:hypothetical protein
VHDALFHFIELAMAYEGVGCIAFVPPDEVTPERTAAPTGPPDPRSDDDALRCLMDVVHRLGQHQADRSRKAQNAWLKKAGDQFARVCERTLAKGTEVRVVSADPPSEIRKALNEIGLRSNDTDVKDVMPSQEMMKDENYQGPVSGAQALLANLTKMSTKTVFLRMRSAVPTEKWRAQWSRHALLDQVVPFVGGIVRDVAEIRQAASGPPRPASLGRPEDLTDHTDGSVESDLRRTLREVARYLLLDEALQVFSKNELTPIESSQLENYREQLAPYRAQLAGFDPVIRAACIAELEDAVVASILG